MEVADLILKLKKKFNVKTDQEIAKHLGMTQAALAGWKKREKPLSALQLANAIYKASTTAVAHSHKSLVRTIVEFFPISRVAVGNANKYQVIPTDDSAGKHLSGLKEKLFQSKGIYIFYDTRGKALYAGQTQGQNLWTELNQAYNRHRSAQVVTLVRHPKNDVVFRPAHPVPRQPKDINLKLHDLAAYFSAFEADISVINNLEALLVRAFPNDLLNFKMEKFGKVARKKSKKASKKAHAKATKRQSKPR